jgi:hypothetical protein
MAEYSLRAPVWITCEECREPILVVELRGARGLAVKNPAGRGGGPHKCKGADLAFSDPNVFAAMARTGGPSRSQDGPSLRRGP